jgi:hypothetical protein
VKISHFWDNRPVILEVSHQLDVEPLIERAMSVAFHYELCAGQPCSLIRRSPLPNALGVVDQHHSRIVFDGRVCPSTVENGDDVRISLDMFQDVLDSSLEEHLVTARDKHA